MSIRYMQEVLTVRGQLQLPVLSITTSPAETAAWNDQGLDKGVYYMWSTVDAWFLHKTAPGGDDDPDATTGVLLLANNPVSIEILLGDVISAQAQSGTGEIHFVRLNRGE